MTSELICLAIGVVAGVAGCYFVGGGEILFRVAALARRLSDWLARAAEGRGPR